MRDLAGAPENCLACGDDVDDHYLRPAHSPKLPCARCPCENYSHPTRRGRFVFYFGGWVFHLATLLWLGILRIFR